MVGLAAGHVTARACEPVRSDRRHAKEELSNATVDAPKLCHALAATSCCAALLYV